MDAETALWAARLHRWWHCDTCGTPRPKKMGEAVVGWFIRPAEMTCRCPVCDDEAREQEQ